MYHGLTKLIQPTQKTARLISPFFCVLQTPGEAEKLEGEPISRTISMVPPIPGMHSESVKNRIYLLERSVDRHTATLAGAHPNDIVKVQDEDLSVPDLSRLCRFRDGGYGAFDEIVIYRDLKLDLFEESAAFLCALIHLRASLLSSLTEDGGYGHQVNFLPFKGLLYLLQLMRLDNCDNVLHGSCLLFQNGICGFVVLSQIETDQLALLVNLHADQCIDDLV